MKKLSLFLFVFLLIFPASVSFAQEAAKPPEAKAHGAVLMELESGRVLWEKDSRKRMPMASTTKIMTALIAIESGELDSVATVSERAARTPPVKMSLSSGEMISLRSLLYALMLQSSNDAAVAIAEHVGGSVERFCEMMTERARELGASDTVFETPNGLDSDNHASTAYDMALITRQAMMNKTFVSIINTRQITVSSDRRDYEITNKNRLLSEFEGANGVKTGYTGGAGHCFVGAAERNGMQLISVVLASGWGDGGKEQKWIDTKRILKYGFDNYAPAEIAKPGDSAGKVSVGRSKTAELELYLESGLTLPLTAAEISGVELSLCGVPESVKAPVGAGEKLGEAVFSLNGEELARIDLVTAEGAARHDLKTCLEAALNAALGLTTRAKPDIILPEWY